MPGTDVASPRTVSVEDVAIPRTVKGNDNKALAKMLFRWT